MTINETENKMYYQRQNGSDFTAFRANLDGSSPEEVVNNTGNLSEFVTSFGYF